MPDPDMTVRRTGRPPGMGRGQAEPTDSLEQARTAIFSLRLLDPARERADTMIDDLGSSGTIQTTKTEVINALLLTVTGDEIVDKVRTLRKRRLGL